MALNNFLILSAFLFCTGIYGVLARKNAVLVLMSIELMLNAVNINLVAYSAFHHVVAGQVFRARITLLAPERRAGWGALAAVLVLAALIERRFPAFPAAQAAPLRREGRPAASTTGYRLAGSAVADRRSARSKPASSATNLPPGWRPRSWVLKP